ncbi:MAG: PRC-barrel domain-containing protein [Thermoleophilaceae bacterium]
MSVSWLMIEEGWEVVDTSGRVAGEVHELVGDRDADIFDGLRVMTPGGIESYVPAARVGDIQDGRVAVSIDAGALPDEDAEPPGGREVRRDRSQGL